MGDLQWGVRGLDDAARLERLASPHGDVPPTEEEYKPHPWQQPHMGNPTGTPAAIRPDGSTLRPVPASRPGATTRLGALAPKASRLHSAALHQQSPAMDLFRLAHAIGRRALSRNREHEAHACRRGDGAFGGGPARRGARGQDQQSDRRFRRPRQDHRPIISFEVAINETVQFGALQITPRVCYSRPPTDAPQTDAFAQVDEIDEQKPIKRIFSGWMFADSPGLHGVEHPIFDIWLTACKGGTVVIRETPVVQASAPNPDESPPTDPGS